MTCLSDGFLLSILRYFSVMMTGQRDFTAELKLKFQKEFFLMKINLCLALLLLLFSIFGLLVLAVKPLNS